MVMAMLTLERVNVAHTLAFEKIDLPQLCVNEMRAFLTRGPENTFYIFERDTVLNCRKYQKKY